MWLQELPVVNMRSTSGEAEDRIPTIIGYSLPLISPSWNNWNASGTSLVILHPP